MSTFIEKREGLNSPSQTNAQPKLQNSKESLSLNLPKASPPQKPKRLEISNKWLYYGTIVDRFIFQAMGMPVLNNLNLYITSMSNQNNYNWTASQTEVYLAYLNCAS